MRVSDLMLTNNFVNNVSSGKSKVDKIRSQIASGAKIQKPSDSPDGVIKLLRLNTQLNKSESFQKNIQTGLAFLKETTMAMEALQGEVSKSLTKLTELGNSLTDGSLKSYADQFDLTLKSLLDIANRQSDGKYLFGGTDNSLAPYGYSSDGKNVTTQVNSPSGVQNVNVSHSIVQRINFPGREIFGTIIDGGGSLNNSASVGEVYSKSLDIVNAEGERYSLDLLFTKTAAGEYELKYDVTDVPGNSSIFSGPQELLLKFNESGQIVSPSDNIKIKNGINKIDFYIDLKNLSEKEGESNVILNKNQDIDIFNRFIMMKDNLLKGIRPSQEDEDALISFNKHLLNKIAEAGNITNQLFDAQELTGNQKAITESLISDLQDVDTAKAVMELQHHDYIMQLSYKISSMILPKSLLDYL